MFEKQIIKHTVLYYNGEKSPIPIKCCDYASSSQYRKWIYIKAGKIIGIEEIKRNDLLLCYRDAGTLRKS